MSIKAHMTAKLTRDFKAIDQDYAILKEGNDQNREVQDQLAGIMELEESLVKEKEELRLGIMYRTTLAKFIYTNYKAFERLYGTEVGLIHRIARANWERMRDARSNT